MMNGLSLLVFLTLFGQIGPLGSTVTDNSQAVDDGKNYGWQINKYNELEYLIQISPDMLGPMNDPVNKRELESQIPRELIGRIKRVVVSIGNETLPRTPLSEIEKLLPAATASLPPGRMQDLESGSIVNVNNNGGDGFPAYSPGQSFSDSGTKTPGTSPLGSKFLQQAGGTAPPATSTALDAYAKQNEQSRFNSTATNDFGSTSTGTAGGNWQTSTTPALPGRTNQSNSSFTQLPATPPSDPQSLTQPTWGGGTQPGFSTQPTTQSQGGYASNGAYGSSANGTSGYGQTGYDSRGYQANTANAFTGSTYAGTQSSGSSRGGFGDTYGQYGSALAQQGRGGSFVDAAAPASGGYLASADRAGLPSTSHDPAISDRNYSQPLQQQQTQGLPGQRTLTAQQQAEQTLQLQREAAALAAAQGSLTSGGAQVPQNYAAQESNYFFYVFFILSIAINLWMVHLLRSLYLRYRNLLSSLRSQATSLS